MKKASIVLILIIGCLLNSVFSINIPTQMYGLVCTTGTYCQFNLVDLRTGSLIYSNEMTLMGTLMGFVPYPNGDADLTYFFLQPSESSYYNLYQLNITDLEFSIISSSSDGNIEYVQQQLGYDFGSNSIYLAGITSNGQDLSISQFDLSNQQFSAITITPAQGGYTDATPSPGCYDPMSGNYYIFMHDPIAGFHLIKYSFVKNKVFANALYKKFIGNEVFPVVSNNGTLFAVEMIPNEVINLYLMENLRASLIFSIKSPVEVQGSYYVANGDSIVFLTSQVGGMVIYTVLDLGSHKVLYQSLSAVWLNNQYFLPYSDQNDSSGVN